MKTLWMWTGFVFNPELAKKEVFNYVDVLVDGQYVDELHDPTLKWKGSSNQRVIDIKKTIQKQKEGNNEAWVEFK
jgi:anaerobic ribonucleoside-triphosphate reductase activating protein